MINQIKCLHNNYKKDDNGKWELTDKRTESVNQKYYNQIVRNLDLERDTRRAYGYQPLKKLPSMALIVSTKLLMNLCKIIYNKFVFMVYIYL